MSRHTITDFTPAVSCESHYASHAFHVSDVISFADALRDAVVDGLDPQARIEFHKSSTGHVIRLSAKSGGTGTKRPDPEVTP